LETICRRAGITLLLVEHDMHFVDALCETVIVLNFGRKIAQGSPGQIRENALVREAYLGIETAPALEQRRAS
jgi:branched-chain amino acid transport system ATP-binding protein